MHGFLHFYLLYIFLFFTRGLHLHSPLLVEILSLKFRLYTCVNE
jgi:hypothetical protein